ncbi:helix-turn-helix domain-containing protein [Nocardia terpenica]|uniref:Helix-turn-helix domain-containing protein n=1 Tax=Nocardia terpenica TaxID=455432 RepID=A0A6G9YZN4_9NOCA|nr:helix-turn-helix transcriptional regulator [Nocardia terpenica]QIS18581.1 helix-turn-helix domain-containing protein [Nocardia terpenica]
MPDQWEFGRRVQAAREALGLSKRRAAELADVSETRWRHLENGWETLRGQKFPIKTTPETVYRVAMAVRLDPDELLAVAGFDPQMLHDPEKDGIKSVDLSGLTSGEIDQVRSFIRELKASKRKAK